MSPAIHRVIVAYQTPGFTAVVRAPEGATIRFLPLPGHAIARLDHGIHAIRVRARDGRNDFPHRASWESMPGQALPGNAAVPRHEQAAAWPAALPAPRVHLQLPHAGKHDARIVRIH